MQQNVFRSTKIFDVVRRKQREICRRLITTTLGQAVKSDVYMGSIPLTSNRPTEVSASYAWRKVTCKGKKRLRSLPISLKMHKESPKIISLLKEKTVIVRDLQ